MEGASLDPIEEAKRKKEAEQEAATAEKEQRARERAERRAELQAKKDAAQVWARFHHFCRQIPGFDVRFLTIN